MTWFIIFKWLLVALFALGAISSIADAAKGEHTKTETPGVNAAVATVSALLALGVALTF